MKALIIGGTRFVGAAIVSELRARKIETTIFSRGETNPELFADATLVEHVRGDRATDLDRLGDRRFDVVFDSCGYTPDIVSPAADLAAEQGAFYAFVSTASVYADATGPVGEDHPLATVDPNHPLVGAPENYGAAKALCEARLRKRLGDRLAIARPGLIVGPGDYTDRYPYWVKRCALGGAILCPGDGADPVQLIDVRDFAAFVVHLGLGGKAGVFNASGPADGATFSDFIAASTPPGAELETVWAPADFLESHGVEPWSDMPCWLPADHHAAGVRSLSLDRSLAAGLKVRPWTETAADTLAWLEAAGRELPFSSGLTRERERALLALLARNECA